MKKLWFLSLLFASAFSISADECLPEPRTQGFYLGAMGGTNLQFYEEFNEGFFSVKPKAEAGFLLGLSSGYKFCDYYGMDIRFEAEFAYRRNEINKYKINSIYLNLPGYTDTKSILANFIMEYPLAKFYVTPYFGVGLGWAFAASKVTSIGETFKTTKNGFVTQYIGGLNYQINCANEVNLEYRFYQQKSHTDDHAITLGLRHYFQ